MLQMWRNLENIILSERSQDMKDYILCESHVYEIPSIGKSIEIAN